MKVYKYSTIVVGNDFKDFHNQVMEAIGSIQSQNLECEVQYSTSTEYDKIIFSALLLGYKTTD